MTAVTTSYRFPEIDRTPYSPQHMPDEVLYRRLNDLVLSMRRLPYSSIREQFCAVNAEINERSLLAPGFRELPTAPKPLSGIVYTADQLNLVRDRIVIDLDWLAKTGFNHRIDDKRYANLMREPTLDLERAGDFACEKWKAHARATLMGLGTFDQFKCSSIQKREVYDRMRYVKSKAQREIQPRLRDNLVAPGGTSINCDEYVSLWMASELDERKSLRATADLYGCMVGAQPLKPATMSEKLGRMRHWTGT